MTAYAQHDKEQAMFDHFSTQFSNPKGRSDTLNWDILDITPQNLSHLVDDFSVEEVRAAINDLPSEKAPGLNRYIWGSSTKLLGKQSSTIQWQQ